MEKRVVKEIRSQSAAQHEGGVVLKNPGTSSLDTSERERSVQKKTRLGVPRIPETKDKGGGRRIYWKNIGIRNKTRTPFYSEG